MFVRVSPCVVPPSISKQCHPRHGNILSPPWNPMEVTRVLSEECMPGMPHCTPWLIIIFRFPMKKKIYIYIYETCHKWWGPPCILDHFGLRQLASCLWVFARNPRLPEFPTNHALKSLVWPALSCEDNLLVSMTQTSFVIEMGKSHGLHLAVLKSEMRFRSLECSWNFHIGVCITV